MKIRTDFVTNSSSSSFIFGEPGKNTINIPDVVNMIRDISKQVMNILGLLDNILMYQEDIWTDIKEIRQGSSNYETQENVENYIENSKGLVKTIENWIQNNGYELTTDDVISSYVNQYDYEKIKNISESNDNWSLPITSEFINLKSDCYSHKDDVLEAIQWFIEDSSVSYSDDSKEIAREAHNKLGEVLVSGECGYIPYIIVQVLYSKATYSCDHMG